MGLICNNLCENFLNNLCFFYFLFLIEGWLLYTILLVSAIHQHESATGIHMSPPSWTSLPHLTFFLVFFFTIMLNTALCIFIHRALCICVQNVFWSDIVLEIKLINQRYMSIYWINARSNYFSKRHYKSLQKYINMTVASHPH